MDNDLKRNPSEQWFKRPIFDSVSGEEPQAAMRERLRNGAYDHLPQEYQTVLTDANGKLDYDGVLVFRMKTDAELEAQGGWEKHPYPMRELTWEEREAYVNTEYVASAVFQVDISENSQGRVGPVSNTLVAVVIFPTSEAVYARNSAGQRNQWKQTPVMF
jgi:hypothetical protein